MRSMHVRVGFEVVVAMAVGKSTLYVANAKQHEKQPPPPCVHVL